MKGEPSSPEFFMASERLLIVAAVIVTLNVSWIAGSHRLTHAVPKRVTEVLRSVVREKPAVEGGLDGHGVLPEGHAAAGLSSPAELHSQHFSEIGISRGNILMKFDEASADAHLAGRYVMLIAARRGSAMSWHCASPDIDDKYPPASCRSAL